MISTVSDVSLEVGQEVMWSGSWGISSKKKATITSISVFSDETPLLSVEWDRLNDRSIVVSLDNGHWAYGFQLTRIN